MKGRYSMISFCRRACWLIVLACSAGAASLPAAATETVSPLGRKAENFTLHDFYGKPHALADYAEKKVVILAFLGTECPLAKLYAPRLTELQKKFADQGVQFLGVNSNRQDSITEMAAYARLHDVTFPLLKDLNNKLADQLGAVRTPEIFVLDQDRVVRYHGRIDDQYGVGYVKKNSSEQSLQLAIEQLLAGTTVSIPETAAVGCYIGRVRPASAAAKVTYSDQVVRILNQNCVSCHREGEIAPFAMTSYEEVSGWADTIAEVVRQQRMPPWHADSKYSHFSNDRSLSDADKELLYQWARDGASEGNRADLPQPPTFVDGWQLPKDPDAVFEMAAQSYAVPAEGTVKYQYFSVDPGFTENKWIRAAEARPGDRSVVHHIIVFSVPKGSERNEGRRQFLVSYAPGASPVNLPQGMAKLVPAESSLLFQVHYTPNGSPHEDLSKVGFVFADPQEISHVVGPGTAINESFLIPPGADDYKVEADSFSLDFDSEIVSMFPHMHLRGKSFRYELRLPDGRSEILLDVPRYDFGWQTTYELANFKPLPKGASLHCTALFDNSENNLNNPDPKSPVRWGDQTWEEMMIGFYDVAVPISQTDIEQGKLPDFSPGSDQIAARLLARFDKNQDGKVTVDEIPPEPAAAKVFFLAMDKNFDGAITLDEVKLAIHDRRKQNRNAPRDDDRQETATPDKEQPGEAKK